MRKLAFTALLLTATLPAMAAAQQAQPRPVVVVSMQKCHLAQLGELTAFMRQNAAPILDDLVKQGKLLNWGFLEHAWGDEWNNVVYYTARDLNTFQGAFGEYFRRLAEREPNLMQRLGGWCSEHKDNIYTLVMTNSVQPPQ